MPIKHKTHQILFLLFAKQNNMHKQEILLPLYKARKTYIYILKYFSPFLSIINKGVKVNTKQCSPPFCQKQKINKGVKSKQSIKRYMRYTFMERET